MDSDGSSSLLRRTEASYADVIVPRHIAKAFTYLVPPTLAKTLEVGSRVLVPFGRVVLEGVVISLSHHLSIQMKAGALKEVRSLVQDGQDSTLPHGLLELSRKIATYYVAPWGQCLRLVFSPTATPNTPPIRYVATQQGHEALSTGSCPDSLKPTLRRIARRSAGILPSTLRPTRQRAASRTIDALIKKSWITLVPLNNTKLGPRKRQGRLVADEHDRPTPMQPLLSPERLPDADPAWGTHVAQCLQSHRMRKIVLHAPWQHRITRLVDAIQQTHATERSTIVLCGEIARAVWLKNLLSSLTGLPITLAHSSSKFDRSQPRQGPTPSIVVGTRSAIFAPVQSIGLIWVDGEEDPALKEPQEPRYHARDVAGLRAESEQALLVLASAHPSLESRFDTGAEMYHVPQDVDLKPHIELVDLRNEAGGTLFSQKLILAMREALEKRAKILLFLNRKGYARTLVCRDCSWVPRCPSCAVPLTYYREAGKLTCRYCGSTDGLPDLCPSCRASRVNPIGDGTERVEAEARRLFPHAKLARLDGDTLGRPASARALWEGARSGAWDILIGTQALFGREPLPQQELVGILQADSGLHVSDFRAAERTYHLLVDAVSLARPASAGGRVVLQTRLPTHHAVQAVLSGDSRQFYDEEFTARQLLNYPPVCHLADLSVTGKDAKTVEEAAKRWGAELGQTAHVQEAVVVLGPVPAISRRPPGHHHHRILVKATDLSILSRRIHDSVQNMEGAYHKGRIKFTVDVDPVETA